MYDLNKKTLSTIKEDPLYQKLDAAKDITLKNFLDNMKKLSSKTPCPVQEVATFYLLDHCLYVLESKHGLTNPMDEETYQLANSIKKSITAISTRMFYFTLSCCIKEISRFPHQNQNAAFYEYIANGYDADMSANLSKGTVTNFKDYSSMPLERFIAAQIGIFGSGKWWFGAGGSGWAHIARAPLNFIRGSMSLHEVTDLSFSLCHDRGSYFDRAGWGDTAQLPALMKLQLGIDKLYTLLDVQASGQIPQFLKSHPEFVTPLASKYLKIFQILDPQTFMASVDKSLISVQTKKRQDGLQKQWAASQAHHNNIAQLPANGVFKPLQEQKKIDKILITDFKSRGLLTDV